MHPVGLLSALLMPLITVSLIVAAGLLLRRYGPRGSFLIAPLLVLGPAYADFAYGKAEFNKACSVTERPLILEQAQANGFLLKSESASGFGARYLDHGFRWIERADGKGGWERVATRPDGSVFAQPVAAPMARYIVIEKIERTAYWVLFSTSVLERESERLIATASRATYAGGRFAMLLTPFNLLECPTPAQPTGRSAWRMVEDLPAAALNPHRADPQKAP